MRRHMKLIRMILEHISKSPDFGNIPPPEIEGYSREEVAYHVRLCSDAGYVVLRKGTHEINPHIIRMTWCGHKALDHMMDHMRG